MFIKKNIKKTIKNIKSLINIKKIINNNIKNKKIINIYNKILLKYNDIKLLYKLYKKKYINYEINVYKDKIKKLIFNLNKLIFNKKYYYSTIIKITSILGGNDSYNWVKILENMYIKWAIINNYSYKILNKYNKKLKKSSLIKIKNKFTYGYLLGENGIHKLIRLSPFNKKKKRQTSLAYVEIYPFKKKKKIIINYKDLIIYTFRSSGSGGQNVNKVETGVRIKHIPTNISVECTKNRSQLLNKNYAIKNLKKKLLILNLKKNKKKKKNIFIRNYVMHPYKLIKDFKTGYKTNKFEEIINGNINDIIFKYIKNKFF